MGNHLESPESWASLAKPILVKLKSSQIELVQQGLFELKIWVKEYNSNYVDGSLDGADLSLFGYLHENWEEGELWPNPLFDNLLENFKKELRAEDLQNLIQALFSMNEDYQDCQATHTAIMYLLEKRTLAIEHSLVKITLHALEGYEPGHRFYEQSLLDRLVDEIFPSFSPEAILILLQGLHPDNLRGEHYGGCGDDFISLAHHMLKKGPSEELRRGFEELIEEFGGS